MNFHNTPKRFVPIISPQNTHYIHRDPRKPHKDFLGNSKTDHLVGAIQARCYHNRCSKTAKQLAKDKRINPNKQKKD